MSESDAVFKKNCEGWCQRSTANLQGCKIVVWCVVFLPIFGNQYNNMSHTESQYEHEILQTYP